MNEINIDVRSLVSPAYYPLFSSRLRYLAYKGSRGSGKSFAMGLKIVLDIVTLPYVNWLVIRQYFGTHKDSTFVGIKRAARALGLYDYFKFTTSPLEITYKPTGQKVFFRGMDDPLKITSINVETGSLCRVWYEEAYELKTRAAFETVEESIRGIIDYDGAFYQSILTFNPWSDKSWLKPAFFDGGKDMYNRHTRAITTTYKDNPWLNDDYVESLEEMLTRNPNRARVAVLGEWGIAEGLVFDGQFESRAFDDSEIALLPHGVGLDFGFKHDPTAGEYFAIDRKNWTVYIYDEFYKHGMLTKEIAQQLITRPHGGKIIADSAEQRMITELSLNGVRGIQPAAKGRDSVDQEVQYMQQFKFVIHPRCKGLFEEMQTYVYAQDKFGNWLNKPEDANNHAIDALRYGLQPFAFEIGGRPMTYQERVAMVKNIGLR